MNDLAFHLHVILIPLAVSNVLHMLVVKKEFLLFFAQPLWTKGFGSNKTWRGFVVLPLLNALALFTLDCTLSLHLNSPFLLGFLLALAYLIFDLPNSFLKRRLGIKSGQNTTKRVLLFKILDKTDSAFGVILTYFLMGYVGIKAAFALFIISGLTHFIVSYLLVKVKIKKSI